jgi:hypothetical protein
MKKIFIIISALLLTSCITDTNQFRINRDNGRNGFNLVVIEKGIEPDNITAKYTLCVQSVYDRSSAYYITYMDSINKFKIGDTLILAKKLK